MNAFTHRGWLGLAPVYIGNLESGSPVLRARWTLFEWWLDLNEMMFGAVFALRAIADPSFEPLWPIRITGELASPIEVPE